MINILLLYPGPSTTSPSSHRPTHQSRNGTSIPRPHKLYLESRTASPDLPLVAVIDQPFLIRFLAARHNARLSLDFCLRLVRKLHLLCDQRQFYTHLANPSRDMRMSRLLRRLQIWNALLSLSGTRVQTESVTVTVTPPEPPTCTLASTQSESDSASKSPKEPEHPTATIPIPPTPIPKPLDNPRPPSPLRLPGPSLALTSPHERTHLGLNDAETIVIRPSPFQPVTLIVPTADVRAVLADIEGRRRRGKRAGRRTTVVENRPDGEVTTRRVLRKRGAGGAGCGR